MDQIRTPVFPVGKPPKTHKASQARYNLTRFVDSKYHGVQTCGVPEDKYKDTKRNWFPVFFFSH